MPRDTDYGKPEYVPDTYVKDIEYANPSAPAGDSTEPVGPSGDTPTGGAAGGSGGSGFNLGSWLTNIWNDFTGVTASNLAAQAAEAASATESAAAQAAIEEERRQFDSMRELMQPWVDQGEDALGRLGQYETAGSDALAQQRALMGLDGPEAQAAALQGLSGGAEMSALVGQGEDALRQQGAATGGLRGGNIQGALAQFRPQMLSSLINSQYSKLGGLIDMGQGITMNRAALGQASSSGLAAGRMQHASSLSDLITREGSATAGGQLAAGNAAANASNLAWQPVRDAAELALAFGLKGAF